MDALRLWPARKINEYVPRGSWGVVVTWGDIREQIYRDERPPCGSADSVNLRKL